MSRSTTPIEPASSSRPAPPITPEAAEHYRLLAEHGSDYVMLSHVDGRRLFLSPSYYRATGWTPEELSATHWRTRLHPDDLPVVLDAHAANLRGEPTRIEHRMLCRDGRWLWVESRCEPVPGPDGRVELLVVWSRDVTERKAADDAWRKSQLRYRRIYDSAVVGIAIRTRDGRFDECNAAYCRLVGYTEAELQQMDFGDLVHPDDRAANLDLVRRLLDGDIPFFETENRYVRKDGQIVWVRKFVSHFPDGKHQPDRLIALVIDVTRQHAAETQLMASEQRLRTLIDAAPVAIALFDAEMRYLAASRRWRSDYDLRDADLLGRSHYEIFPDLPERWKEAHRRALAGEVVQSSEDQFTRADGQVQWLRWEARPWRTAAGTVGGLVLFTEDVTPRRSAEQRLSDREERLATILKTASDAIITVDQAGTIDSVNAAAETMFGYAPGELIGQNVRVLMPSPFRDEHDGYIARYLRTSRPRILGTGREVVGQRKDGTIIPVEVSLNEIDHSRQFTGIVRDISERKRLQAELLAVAAEEQSRIGQDLHDGVGQELFALSMIAQTLAESLHDPAAPPVATDEQLEWVAKLNTGLQRCQQQVRDLAHGLVPFEVKTHGLAAALQQLAERTNAARGCRCTYVPVGESLDCTNEAAAQLYRIAQEAVANAVRHSRADEIRITLAVYADLIRLEVTDNGIGFPELPPQHDGLGLKTMRYRASLIGGQLAVTPAHGGGTTVRCLLNRKLALYS